jgi:hypothetical protein
LVPSRIAQSVGQLTGSVLQRGNTEVGRAMPTPRAAEPQTLQYTQTDVRTFFTAAGGTQQLVKPSGWVRIRLLLETAGPVAVGTRANLSPVLSGTGILLDTDVEFETVLTRGGALYIAAEGVNRVKVIIEPLPWMETISLQIGMAIESVRALGAILNLFRKARS